MEITETTRSILGWVAAALLTILMAVAGYQQSAISKLDDRIYTLQATTVTDDKLNTALNRLSSDMESRITAVRTEVTLTNKYLERMMEKMDSKPSH